MTKDFNRLINVIIFIVFVLAIIVYSPKIERIVSWCIGYETKVEDNMKEISNRLYYLEKRVSELEYK